MTGSYNVAVESREVVIRFDKAIFDRESIVKFLDYLELESIRRRSRLTQEQADAIADDIDRAGWQRLKDNFVQQ